MSFISQKNRFESKVSKGQEKFIPHSSSDPLAHMLKARDTAEAKVKSGRNPGVRLISVSKEEFIKRYS